MGQALLQRSREPALPAASAAVLLRRLSLHAALSPAEAELVRAVAAGPLRQHPAQSQLCAEGATCPPRFVVSGWACRQRILDGGGRQIVCLLLPGDPIGPVLAPRLPEPCAVVALTQVETVDGAMLGVLAEAADQPCPGIVHALRTMAWQDGLRLHDQVVRLGRQAAQERLLHLLLELRDRLHEVGLGTRERFPLPLTQEVLADALGLSVVHVNRMLQQVRRDGLLEVRSGVVTLLRPERIEAAAEWRPAPGITT